MLPSISCVLLHVCMFIVMTFQKSSFDNPVSRVAPLCRRVVYVCILFFTECFLINLRFWFSFVSEHFMSQLFLSYWNICKFFNANFYSHFMWKFKFGMNHKYYARLQKISKNIQIWLIKDNNVEKHNLFISKYFKLWNCTKWLEYCYLRVFSFTGK